MEEIYGERREVIQLCVAMYAPSKDVVRYKKLMELKEGTMDESYSLGQLQLWSVRQKRHVCKLNMMAGCCTQVGPVEGTEECAWTVSQRIRNRAYGVLLGGEDVKEVREKRCAKGQLVYKRCEVDAVEWTVADVLAMDESRGDRQRAFVRCLLGDAAASEDTNLIGTVEGAAFAWLRAHATHRLTEDELDVLGKWTLEQNENEATSTSGPPVRKLKAHGKGLARTLWVLDVW